MCSALYAIVVVCKFSIRFTILDFGAASIHDCMQIKHMYEQARGFVPLYDGCLQIKHVFDKEHARGIVHLWLRVNQARL